MKSIFNLLGNKWVKVAILVVFFQQCLVALGTYYLGKLSSEYPTEGFKLSSAFILFICIFLAGTIVHYFVVWCTVRASKMAQLEYLNQYIHANYNHPSHWRSEKSKNQRHDIMCRGGQETINVSIHFLVDLASTSLNIILNTISIMLVTDLTLGLIILVAGFSGLGFIHLSEKNISRSSRNEILADNQLNAHLSRSWDNIILGNQFFFNRWKQFLKEYFQTSEKAALQIVKSKDWAVAMAGMLTNGMVMGGALILAWKNQTDIGFVLAILVMLPRCLQTVLHIQVIQTYIAQWKNLKEKLSVTQESIIEAPYIDLTSLIQYDKIKIRAGNRDFAIQDIDGLLKQSKMGRWTITGPNGAGKSTLLLNIKNRVGIAATYLPAQHQLMLSDGHFSFSSGEKALAALKDLQSKECGILLLDEWDANLSTENRDLIDEVIDQLSLERIVIEVRHFHNPKHL